MSKIIITLYFVLLFISSVMAGVEPFHQRMQSTVGTPVTVGTASAEKTVIATAPGGGVGYTNLSVQNFITLGIDHEHTTFFGTAFDLEVDVYVTPTVGSPFPITLAISYNPFGGVAYQDVAVKRFTDKLEFDYEITEIRYNSSIVTVLPLNVYLDGDIIINRAYDFTADADDPITINDVSGIDLDCAANELDDEIEIAWTTVPTAIEYQLEWVFINDFTGEKTTDPDQLTVTTGLQYDFKFNSTRISTSDVYYRIPLLFERGYVLFRVRALGVDPSDPDKIIAGVWSTGVSGDVDAFMTSEPNAFYHVTTPHEENKNWQVTTTFAEEGKKKEVISYYDGSLRNRQSVTKVNTDNNIIVGETIYDHQGRPAVNVLPVPVYNQACEEDGQQVFKFYENFNQNTSNEGYSKLDFDLDENCVSAVAPMSTDTGASQYYSSNNPVQTGQQAYVPDAEGYPFTRVEYTPDNTGRIRAQSGVGPEFKLGTGHESQYFYGKPMQIELDRLFGSEVGNADHYKKNMVIDPNGQVSVSYLDQEGRVIATSLAGEVPENLQGIESSEAAAVNLEVNLKNNNNDVNTPEGTLSFSQSLLVSQEGAYVISYDLTTDIYEDACVSEICFNCVYDLEITLTDDCGNVVLDNQDPPQPIHIDIKEGHFERDSETGEFVSFVSDCTADPNYSSSTYLFETVLLVGNYNLTKTIKVNEEAAQYNLQNYLNPTNNSCILTLEDFIDEAMEAIDITDCYDDCELCATELGTRDEFVEEGRGSSEDYDLLLQQCDELCSDLSMCEVMYELLIADITPGGQYAQYEDISGNFIGSSFPLSIFNSSNKLPVTTALWSAPSIVIDGITYTEFLDDNNTPSVIYLTEISLGTYLPATTNVQTDSDGNKFTYPSDLVLAEDFILNWKDSWARSLVLYHPEYCYYEYCVGYTEEDANGLSSEEFDAKLRNLTFDEAVTAGYITGNSTIGFDVDLSDDPFVSFTTGANYEAAYATALSSSITSYKMMGGTMYSMKDIASVVSRCANTSMGVVNTDPDCYDFGIDVTGNTTAENEALHNLSWSTFVSLYLSKKTDLQNYLYDQHAIDCGGFNDCIGNEAFNPMAKGFYSGSPFPSGGTNPYFDDAQPCSNGNQLYYLNKIKRFPDSDDIEYDVNEVNYQLYQQTGQCPNARNFELMLNEMASEELLLLDYDLNDLDAFAIFWMDYSNSTTPADIFSIDYVSSTSTQIDLEITRPNATTCDIILTSPSALDWADVVGFTGLQATGFTSPDYEFTVYAKVIDGTGYAYIQLTGTTPCFDMLNCHFGEVCEPNQFALDLQLLMTTLAQENEFISSSFSFGSDSDYDPFVTPVIASVVGTPASMDWEFTSSPAVAKIVSTEGELILTFNYSVPAAFTSFSSIEYFANINSTHGNYFSVDAYGAGGMLLATLHWSAVFDDGVDILPISMGSCGSPTPLYCQTNSHLLREDLEALLHYELLKDPFDDDIDVYASPALTPLLLSYLPVDETESVGTETTVYSAALSTYVHTLTLEMGSCDWVLSFTAGEFYDFGRITSLENLVTTGSSINGDYYSFTMEGVAEYSSVPVDITITGTSCLPLKDCDVCVSAENILGDTFVEEEEEMMMMSMMSGCEGIYNDYEDAILAFNASAYAIHHDIELVDLTYSETYCDCYADYIDYLYSYLEIPTDLTKPLPIGLISFCESREAPCEAEHDEYTKFRTTFNNYVIAESLGWPSVPSINYNTFVTNDYCYCIDAYIAYLQGLMDGTITTAPTEGDLLIANHCAATPCAPEGNPLIGLEPYSEPYVNPCMQQLIDQAEANALYAYTQYINTLSATFLADYKAHCMSILMEDFNVSYDLREYHYTLYYYDQAGNLVKTIPPAGVEILPITASTDEMAEDIALDRANGTKTVFTAHRLATRYMYNSLNQLVKQSLPDHEQMDIWELTLPNGLDADLTVEKIQFVNSSLGYLSGWKEVTVNSVLIKRGMLYRTTNGGNNWTRVNDVVGTDFNRLRWLNSNVVIALGNGGVYQVSYDQGSNWDMANLYAQNITENLRDAVLTSGNLYLVGDNRTLVHYYAPTGVTTVITPVNTGASQYDFNTTDDITSIVLHSSIYYITVNKDLGGGVKYGVVYSSTNLTNWTPLPNLAAPNFNTINFISNTTAYAVGNDGLLVKTTDGGTNWFVQPTNIRTDLQHVYFKDANKGVAIIEGHLYATYNGGLNWTVLDQDHNYTSFFVYDATGYKVVAAGDDGIISRLLLNGSGNVGIITDQISTQPDLTAVWGDVVSGATHIMATTDDGYIFHTNNIDAANPFWMNHNSTITAGFKAIVAKSGTLNVKGALIDNNDNLYGLEKTGGNTLTLHTITVASADFKSIVHQSGSSKIIAYNLTNHSLYEVSLTGTPNAATLINAVSVGSSVAQMSIAPNADILMTTGSDIYKATVASPYTYTDQSLHMRPQAMNHMAVSNSTHLVIPTINGQVLRKNISTGSGTISIANTTNDLNSVAYQSGDVSWIVGENGSVQKIDGATLTFFDAGTTKNLNAIGITGTTAYIGGDNGFAFYISALTTTPVVNSIATNATADLNSVAISSAGKVLYGGNNSRIYLANLGTMMQIKQVFTPALTNVHFADQLNGYVVGENYTIRKTTDGGNHFYTVLPSTGFGSGVPTAKGVFTKGANSAILTGVNGYAAVVSDVTATLAATVPSTSYPMVDVAFSTPSTGYAVGGSGGDDRIWTTTNGGTVWSEVTSTVGAELHTMHMFGNGTFLAAGATGNIIFVNGSTVSDKSGTLTATTTLRDIFFHDDVSGYIVGDDGTMLKSINGAIDGFGILTNDIDWDDKTLTDATGIQATAANKELKAIAFPTRYNGIVGGSYTGGTPYGYIRKVHDESEEFSTHFYYDKLGRIVASQNSRQYNESPKKYSYTLYDELGRVVEAGEKTENTSLHFATIFGSTISGQFNPRVIDDTKLNDWITDDGDRKQVTRSYYDETVSAVASTLPGTFSQNNLRKRIAMVTFETTFDDDDETYESATHYNYDIHGNVTSLIQDNKKMADENVTLADQQFKRMDYTYDLISGNVHQVSYQRGEADAWHHRYEYDGDNRITAAYTSKNPTPYSPDPAILTSDWQLEARYHYYHHGPLARVELGQHSVQGTDYAYTLQGWLKGVNSDVLTPNNDIGQDGVADGGSLNAHFARDAHGFSLRYFAGDYAAIDSDKNLQANNYLSELSANVLGHREELYNGNIGAMVTTITSPTVYTSSGGTPDILPQATAYRYDQLNRLLEARAFQSFERDPGELDYNEWGATETYDTQYMNIFKYDANGNIVKQGRRDHQGTIIDSIEYSYYKSGSNILQNRLYHVKDSYNYAGDDIYNILSFDPTPSTMNSDNNFGYDEIGQLIRDDQEDIEEIVWRVDGKIEKIIRTPSSPKKNLTFDYDPMGNRIAKHTFDSDDNWEKSTYYVRDAQGNVISVYEHTVEEAEESFVQKEKHIYGSSRIGMEISETEMIEATVEDEDMVYYIGNKQYELSNHLGNVLAVITDKKIPVESTVTSGEVGYYEPEIVTAMDYSPFGVVLEDRKFESDAYRYGFQGQEKDDEIKGEGNSVNYTYRMHDTRLGRFFAIDPLAPKYAHYSPYSFSGNRVIDAIELEGLEPVQVHVIEILKDGTTNTIHAQGTGWEGGINDVNVNGNVIDLSNYAQGSIVVIRVTTSDEILIEVVEPALISVLKPEHKISTEEAAKLSVQKIMESNFNKPRKRSWWEHGGRGPWVAFMGLFMSDESEKSLENNLRSVDDSNDMGKQLKGGAAVAGIIVSGGFLYVAGAPAILSIDGVFTYGGLVGNVDSFSENQDGKTILGNWFGQENVDAANFVLGFGGTTNGVRNTSILISTGGKTDEIIINATQTGLDIINTTSTAVQTGSSND